MKGFRRAQLTHGSDELFRDTTGEHDEPVAQQTEIQATATVQAVHPVPAAPAPDLRSVRLNSEEIELIAKALQHLKFPQKETSRPSVDDFELLEELRQKLLSKI